MITPVFFKFDCLSDARGWFAKPFPLAPLINEQFSLVTGADLEVYFSYSQAGVIRGMHAQLPPSDHDKVVFVLSGEIIDVVLDLKSFSYKTQSESLGMDNRFNAVFVPKGFAHGFHVISESALVGYIVNSLHDPDREIAIRYDSFGFDWNCNDPILSERDNAGILYEDYFL